MVTQEKERSNKLIIIILLVLLLVLVIGVSYSLYIYSGEGKQNNTISTGDLIFSYTESTNGIYIDNAMPLSDDIGKELKCDNTTN